MIKTIAVASIIATIAPWLMMISRLPAGLLATAITEVMAVVQARSGIANGKMAILSSVENASFPHSRRACRLLASMSSVTKSRMMPPARRNGVSEIFR